MAETPAADLRVAAQVRRELLRTALLEAWDGALPLVFTAAVLAWIAWTVRQPVAGAAVLAISIVVALWRALMLRRLLAAESRAAQTVPTEREFGIHAFLSGMIATLTAAFIYPASSGIHVALVIAAFAAMISVATLYITLVGRALLYYLLPQLLAFFVVSLVDPRVYSPLFALGIPVFYLTLRRAAQRHRAAVELAITRRIETDAINVALAQAKARAEAASVAKTQFLANMSHEIRTPMTGVLGALGLVSSDELSPQQRELVEIATSSSEALLTVLNEVLDFAKIEAGNLELVNEPLRIHAVVASTIKLFAPLAQRRGLTLTSDIDPAVPIRVEGDAARIRQVLMNLVGNAVKFTEHGAITVRVHRAAEATTATTVVFEVTDTGIGIPAEALPELFAPFHQVDTSDGRRFGGTGLGLVISKRLVDAMGGGISVESEPGRGSTFRVALPLTEIAGEAESTTVAAARAELAGRVLLVEDNAINRETVHAMLRALGIGVVAAEHGQEALERLAGESFDLILMDCQMPVMDGFSATREIRERERARLAPRTPIIAVTAHALGDDSERCLQAGMDAYLAKPFTRDQLREAITPWLADSR
ncbi:MAG: ATP-binding protein [Betaproteobacteria bacterium]|nr:ATP-binding protein [Betaproteobacteria bacterium]